jgi:HD superfamily phosphodiesterase
MADRIAQAEGADRRWYEAPALLHDIGLEEGRAGHETSAANRAKEVLRAHEYDDVFCSNVAHAIESHRFRSGPTANVGGQGLV